MMSAFVCPGLGQFMQGRKLAGIFFLSLFLVPFASALIFFIRIIRAFYGLGLDLNSDPGNIKMASFGIVVSFAAAITVYAISLTDTIRAARIPPPLPKA